LDHGAEAFQSSSQKKKVNADRPSQGWWHQGEKQMATKFVKDKAGVGPTTKNKEINRLVEELRKAVIADEGEIFIGLSSHSTEHTSYAFTYGLGDEHIDTLLNVFQWSLDSTLFEYELTKKKA
jgi:hypothetical protein